MVISDFVLATVVAIVLRLFSCCDYCLKMSDISERPGVLDRGYDAPIREFEVERPAASATGMADLAEVTLPTNLSGSVHTPAHVQPASARLRTHNVIDVALWITGYPQAS